MPVKLEKSLQVCLLFLPTVSQSLLRSTVYTFSNGAAGFLHICHSVSKGHITTLQFFLGLLFPREEDTGCQIAKGACKEKNIGIWRIKSSWKGPSMAQRASGWQQKRQIDLGGRSHGSIQHRRDACFISPFCQALMALPRNASAPRR